jgi:hypothetical protein
MGVFWIYQFEPNQTFDWSWVTPFSFGQ